MQTQRIFSIKSPLGPPVEILKHVFPAQSNNPRVSFVAGLHGDELEGLYVCHKLLRYLKELEASNPEAIQGEINIYPAVNPQALDNATRLWPFFSQDINRTFGPGQTESLAVETSQTLLEDLKASSDIVVDFHSSNLQLMELPQIRVIKDFEKKLLPLAKKCNVDLVWVHPNAEIFASTLGFNLNIAKTPTLVIETGICHRIHPEQGDQIFKGVLNLLREAGTLDIKSEPVKEPLLVQPDHVKMVQTQYAGLFIKQVEVGQTLEEGERIGQLIDPVEGSVLKEIVSPCSGLLFTLREHPLVHKGSPLARIAEDLGKK
ncbi:MAG: M14 family metallopeptidase [Nitrospinota bacterium]